MRKPKILGFTEDGAYVAYELEIEPDGRLIITGDTGYLLSEKALEEANRDFIENTDFEEEFGYLADEQGIFDPEERKQFFEQLKEDLSSGDTWAYPHEINYNLPEIYYEGEPYYFTLHGTGQLLDEYDRITRSILSPEEIQYVKEAHLKWHPKKAPKSVINHLVKIFSKIDNEKVAKLWLSGRLPRLGKKKENKPVRVRGHKRKVR